MKDTLIQSGHHKPVCNNTITIDVKKMPFQDYMDICRLLNTYILDPYCDISYKTNAQYKMTSDNEPSKEIEEEKLVIKQSAITNVEKTYEIYDKDKINEFLSIKDEDERLEYIYDNLIKDGYLVSEEDDFYERLRNNPEESDIVTWHLENQDE